MATPIKTLAAVAAGTVLATGALAQSAKIEHHIAKIDGTGFDYVTAGTGDPVLLIPGWPESWIAGRKGSLNSPTANLTTRLCTNLLFLPRARQRSRLCLHPLRTLIGETMVKVTYSKPLTALLVTAAAALAFGLP